MQFQLLGVFAEFGIIVAHVKAGLTRTTKRLGPPPIDGDKPQPVMAMLSSRTDVGEEHTPLGGRQGVIRLKQKRED